MDGSTDRTSRFFLLKQCIDSLWCSIRTRASTKFNKLELVLVLVLGKILKIILRGARLKVEKEGSVAASGAGSVGLPVGWSLSMIVEKEGSVAASGAGSVGLPVGWSLSMIWGVCGMHSDSCVGVDIATCYPYTESIKYKKAGFALAHIDFKLMITIKFLGLYLGSIFTVHVYTCVTGHHNASWLYLAIHTPGC